MGYPVTYHCPACETIVEIERDGYLADKAVTPYPFEGWTYADPTESFEDDAADGVRFVCGESDGVVWDPHGSDPDDRDEPVTGTPADQNDDDAGCGESFYLSFVRYKEGREVDPRSETELVEIDPDPRPDAPRGPSGPDGGFW